MALGTKIQWATATWNPFIGCSKVSPACDNCYAETWAKRCVRDFSKVVRAASETFKAPLKWKEPQRIFVCSLSDFFHPDIFRGDRHAAIHIMRDAPQHTYMLLTKRPENIKPMLLGTAWGEALPDNVWVGVTAENQEQADRRIPLLLRVPARVRFVSCEPLVGSVDLKQYLPAYMQCGGCGYRTNESVGNCKGYCFDATGKSCDAVPCPKCGKVHYWCGSMASLNWVIAGGESGPHARPMYPAWVRALRDQCAAAGVSFMFKQWGEFSPYYKTVDTEKHVTVIREYAHGVGRVGKAEAGRLLDGKEHNGVPA